MDNLLEILVPLIFAAIYFFGNMLGKSKDEEDAPPMRRAREAGEDGEAAERQRRIQEEIRRKIMERRQAASGDQPQVAPAGREQSERRRELESRREVREVQREEPRESVDESQPVPPALAREKKEDVHKPVFSWNESDDAYDTAMQAQLKQIEATKRRAEKLRKEAAEKRKVVEGRSRKERQTGGYFTGSVRESLQDPQAARVAFIYGEVLGRPVSLRKEQSVPGLN